MTASELDSARKAAHQNFPLSSGQERLWFLEQMNSGLSAYNVPEAWQLEGDLDVGALEKAVEEIIRRHETLRTRIAEEGGKPVQQVLSAAPFRLKTLHVTESTLTAALAAEAGLPFNLETCPLMRATLFRLSPRSHVLQLTLHHIICDDWSLGVLARDLFNIYASYRDRRTEVRDALPIQFADFAVWERSQDQEQAAAQALAYWKTKLAGEIPHLEMPWDAPRRAAFSFRGDTVFHTIPMQVVAKLGEVCREHRVTLFSGLLTAFNALLYRYTRQEDLVIGGVFAGREMVETEDLVGFFAKTLPLRSHVRGDAAFAELLAPAQQTTLEASTHQAARLDRIVQEVCPARDTRTHPVFQMLLALQPSTADERQVAGLTARRLEVPSGGAKFDLTLLTTEAREGLKLRCEYSTDLYQRGTIERLLGHYEQVIRSAVQNPNQTLANLSLLTPEERDLVLVEWNKTRGLPAVDVCLHELFEQQAKRTPDRIAVVDGHDRITYADLNARANKVAAQLRAHGLQIEEPVAVCMRRDASMVVALLGVLKAGGAYVPMDPAYPAERLAYMLENSGARVLLRNVGESLPIQTSVAQYGVEEWVTSVTRAAADAPRPIAANLSHIIYTSGSTGRPKGVALEHRNAVALMQWARSTYSDEELSGVMASTSICFDLSVYEIFAPLSWGGTVIMADNALALPELPLRDKVTLVNTVPSAIRELLRLKAIPQTVRVVNLAGEPLPAELADRIYAETRVSKVYDLYGPTETTTYSTGGLREQGRPATIGRPLPGERAYVLDGQMKPAPVGISGELYLAGAGVARGYYRNPEATQARFLPDPFMAGERMYRTGDLARWKPNGTLEYLGRIDHQVKLRGYRIEPGEIESILRQEVGVGQVAVIVREDRPGDPRLVAYVVPGAGVSFDVETALAVLAKRLPSFMTPSHFVTLTALPMTPNGKLDRQALPSPGGFETMVASVPAIAPRNANEQAIWSIWRELLGRESFGVQDNFFELGGHSLIATQVISRINAASGKRLPLSAIFEHSTVAALALATEGAPTEADIAPITRRAKSVHPEQLLASLDGLSDDQIEELLRQTDLSEVR